MRLLSYVFIFLCFSVFSCADKKSAIEKDLKEYYGFVCVVQTMELTYEKQLKTYKSIYSAEGEAEMEKYKKETLEPQSKRIEEQKLSNLNKKTKLEEKYKNSKDLFNEINKEFSKKTCNEF